MLGSEGIAVGMATRMLPHNLVELWEAQIELLEGERIALEPDFPQGGFADVSDYDDGRGSVEIRARMKTPDTKKIESLRSSHRVGSRWSWFMHSCRPPIPSPRRKRQLRKQRLPKKAAKS